MPFCSLIAALNSLDQLLEGLGVEVGVVARRPFSFFLRARMTSNGSWSSLLSGFMPSTTSPYMATKRR